MVVAAMKHMASNFAKLDKFEGVDYRRWGVDFKDVAKEGCTSAFHMSVEIESDTVVNMVEHKNSSRYNDNKGKRKHHDNTRADPNKKANRTCWKYGKTGHIKRDFKGVNVGNKANGSGTKGSVDGSSNSLKDWAMVPTLKRNQDILKDRFIIPISLLLTWTLKSNRLSSVLRPSLGILKGTEDIGGLVVPEKVTKEVVQQPEPEHRKGKRNKTPKDFGQEFQLYLIEGKRDEVSDQHSYCFNSINDEMDSIMGNNTWVLVDLPLGYKPLSCKWIFKRKLKVDGTIEKFKAKLVIQGFRKKSGIDYFDTYALVAHISTIRLLIAMTSIHNLIIHQIDVKTAFLNGELDKEVYINQPQGFIMPGNKNKVDLTKEFLSSMFSIKDMGEANVILGISIKHENNRIAISQSHYIEKGDWLPDVRKYLKKTMDYRLTYIGYPSVLEVYTDASWISNIKDISSTSGWVFLLGGGAISWASKKQTCITGSTMEFEFVALAAAGKEAEWLKKLLLEIPLWSKAIAPISIRCDSVVTLAKAYIQMYNRKSRHLGVRHSMIREPITNGVVSIEFVRSQQNLVVYLTKGLAKTGYKVC
ncbi:zinc finger, CCHC-type containing protein [Tanacetum coccineum]|uniref:Zinc finger, CCHC-type containing protein n=1 Tax=Tanacetum coccineum TaxID=301880 RepID=A0ABQ4ZVR0_9ASTR